MWSAHRAVGTSFGGSRRTAAACFQASRSSPAVTQQLPSRGQDLVFLSLIAGVPKSRRGEIWQFLALQYRLRHRLPTKQQPPDISYKELLKQLTAQQHAILVDLGMFVPVVGCSHKETVGSFVEWFVRWLLSRRRICRPVACVLPVSFPEGQPAFRLVEDSVSACGRNEVFVPKLVL